MLDWKEFVERQSAVEHILREDPAGIHERMSFASRDHYRRIVQRLARYSPLDEEQVARAAIEHARKAAADHGSQKSEARSQKSEDEDRTLTSDLRPPTSVLRPLSSDL
jgi:hypothetical protein